MVLFSSYFFSSSEKCKYRYLNACMSLRSRPLRADGWMPGLLYLAGGMSAQNHA